MTTPPYTGTIGPATKAEIQRMRSVGLTPEQIADQFGWPLNVVLSVIRKLERERRRP
jgi:hypothetical protein